jgi:nucleoside-triphosphatase THEP1
MSVVIFSRGIRTGKTTELLKWIDSNKKVAGVLMPDQDGRRMFYDIAEKIFFPAEADPVTTNESMNVGSFVFDAAAFRKAVSIIEKAGPSGSLIIIDEIGKLELGEKGFSEILQQLTADDRDLLIVVRDTLLTAVVEKFRLSRARIIVNMADY